MLRYLILPTAILCAFAPAISAQTRSLITEPVNENRTHMLRGNTRPEAIARNDRGQVSNDMELDHMLLQLKRPADRETAAVAFVDSLHDSSSPNFHKWITAEEFGNRF